MKKYQQKSCAILKEDRNGNLGANDVRHMKGQIH